MDQLVDNLRIFEHTGSDCLTDEERALLTDVRKAYESRVRVAALAVVTARIAPKRSISAAYSASWIRAICLTTWSAIAECMLSLSKKSTMVLSA